MTRLYLIIILLKTCLVFGYSQNVSTFEEKLKLTQLEWLEPLEAAYKIIDPKENDYQNYDYAVYFRKEKLEIRYVIVPHNASDITADLPNIKAGRLMLNLSSNMEEFTGSAFSYTDEAAKEDFNADWANEYLFKPKKAFSSYPNCRMLTIHKKGVGTAHIFLLFDKIPEMLDARTISLRFLENQGD